MRDNDYIQNAKYYADRMELAALLLERVNNDYYIDQGYGCYKSKSCVDEEGYYQSKVVYVDAQEFFEKYPRECFKATIQSVDKVKIDAPRNVTFVGFQDKNEMWSIADIALCTSDSEGMPLSLIEAQMAGVPVVSTNVGSVSEILEDGVTGYLAAKDIKDLSAKIEMVIEDLESGAKLGKAAKLRAKREFSSSVMADAHLGVYKEVLDKVSR